MKSWPLLITSVLTLAELIWTGLTPHKTWQLVVVAIGFSGFTALTIFSEVLYRRKSTRQP